MAETRGIPKGVSAVTVFAAGAPRQVMNEWTTEPAEILETFAAEMRTNQLTYSIYPGNYAIVIPAQLRTHLETAGWSKADVAHFLYDRARVRRRDWADVGKRSNVRDRGDSVYRALPTPDHLLVVAAGGPRRWIWRRHPAPTGRKISSGHTSDRRLCGLRCAKRSRLVHRRGRPTDHALRAQWPMAATHQPPGRRRLR